MGRLAMKLIGRQIFPARRLSPPSTVDALEFGRLFIREPNEPAVHLAQAFEKDRNIDILVLVARLERSEPAVKKGVFGSVYQMRNDPCEPERKSFIALVPGNESKYKNLSDLIDLAFFKMLVNETISKARDWLSIDAHDLLANIPIAHFHSHSRLDLTLQKNGLSYLALDINVCTDVSYPR